MRSVAKIGPALMPSPDVLRDRALLVVPGREETVIRWLLAYLCFSGIVLAFFLMLAWPERTGPS
jgi:hypothetical protein